MFCGDCGTNLCDAFAELSQRNTNKLATADQMRQEGRYYEAMSVLHGIVSKGDSRLEQHVELARVHYEEISELRDQKSREADEAFERAHQELVAHRYAAAQSILDRIPVSVRTPKFKEKLQQVEQLLSKVQALTRQIKASLQAKQFDHLLPYVLELQELTPEDASLVRLANQLRRRQDQQNVSSAQQQLMRAKAQFKQCRYEKAAQHLVQIERESVPKSWQATYDTIVEADWLARQIKNSPFSTPQLQKFANRLRKLNPNDPQLAKLADQVAVRLKRQAPDGRFVEVWSKAAHDAIGVPVRHWQGFDQVDGVDECKELQQDSVQFLVAYGLALQGLGLAHLSPNLLGRDDGAILQRLKNLRSKATLDTVWGIDLGAAGLSAIELTRDKPGERPRVTDAVRISHSRPLSEATAGEETVRITQESVLSLLEHRSIPRSKAVVSFSGPKSLGRFFEIPKLRPNKMIDAVSYEAKMQIPIPIEEINFDWHVWDNEDNDARFVGITLVAARKDQLADTLMAFAGSPIKPIAIQSCCLALYNAAHYEFWRDAEASPAPIAILDVGTEASTLIVGSPRQIRYRSLSTGTEKMSRFLMTRFNLTRDRAEQAREQWTGQHWMYQLDQELVPLYREMSAEVQRTLAAYRNEGIRVEQLIVTGGGSRQYGLLRHFVHGDSDQLKATLAD